MTDFEKQMKQFTGSAFDRDDAREYLAKIKALGGGYISESSPGEQYTIPELSELIRRTTEAAEAMRVSNENLHNILAGMNVFLFHCLAFVMREIVTNPAAAVEAKAAIKRNIQQQFPDESPVKENALNYCENLFNQFDGNSDGTITAGGEH